jgi:hypothetical protein
MTRKGVRICGTSSNNKKSTGKILTPSQSLKFRQRGEQDLVDRMLTMSEEERQAFDHLREPEWFDVPHDAMDLDSILDGSAVVDLSHEGGEFYELVQHCVETTSRLSSFFLCLNKFVSPLLI